MATIKLTTENKILKQLEESGIENTKVNQNSSGIFISSGNKYYARFTFQISDYNFCCGMREIGEIIVSSINVSEELMVNLIIKYLKRLMNDQIDNITSEDTNNDPTLGFSVTIPYEKDEYKLFLKAIDKIGFKEVAEFKNKNSGNRLKHFIFIW